MGRKTDSELFLEVYELYVSSETYSDYNDRLNELSLQTNKTVRYLKDLLEEYSMKLSKEQQNNIKITKKRHLEYRKNNNFQSVVERLSKMSLDELNEYLSEKVFSEVKISFNKYFDKVDDQESLKVARETLSKIKEIYDQRLKEKSLKKEQEVYELATEFFDVMLDNGLFDFVDFRRKFFSKFKMSEDCFYYYIDKYKKFLREKYPDKYSYYVKGINKNKMKFIFEHASAIKDMLDRIPENYDIIDYYVNIGLSIDVFRRLCVDFLDSVNIIRVSMFFEKYVDLMNNNIKDVYSLQIPSYTIFNGFVLTDDIEKQILNFMSDYNIPRNFYVVCVEKCKQGELDSYLNIRKNPSI